MVVKKVSNTYDFQKNSSHSLNSGHFVPFEQLLLRNFFVWVVNYVEADNFDLCCIYHGF